MEYFGNLGSGKRKREGAEKVVNLGGKGRRGVNNFHRQTEGRNYFWRDHTWPLWLRPCLLRHVTGPSPAISNQPGAAVPCPEETYWLTGGKRRRGRREPRRSCEARRVVTARLNTNVPGGTRSKPQKDSAIL